MVALTWCLELLPTAIRGEGSLLDRDNSTEENSPNGKALLVVSHEISDATTILEIKRRNNRR
jgi:hypothetical protein